MINRRTLLKFISILPFTGSIMASVPVRSYAEVGEHDPLFPVRKGHVGEQVFYEKWQEFMNNMDTDYYGDDPVFCKIFRNAEHLINDRARAVCASFVVWLGTNCGHSYIWESRRLASKKVYTYNSSERSFLSTWNDTNSRALNSGVRQIEAILWRQVHSKGSIPFWPTYEGDDITVDDYETLEVLTFWLGSAEGLDFYSSCEVAMDKRKKDQEKPFHMKVTG